MSHYHEKLKRIEQEIQQCQEKKLELEKELYFFQFMSSPQINYLKERIVELKSERKDTTEIIKASMTFHWNLSPFYSKRLVHWGFKTPWEQMGFYATVFTSTYVLSKSLWISWNINMAAKALKKESDTFNFYRFCSGLNNKQLKDAIQFRHWIQLRGVGMALILMGGYTGWIQYANKVNSLYLFSLLFPHLFPTL